MEKRPDQEQESTQKEIEQVARLLDSRFRLPGGISFGLDSILGLIPGIGDFSSGALGLWIVYKSRQLGASRFTQSRMIINLILDSTLGSIPILGDIFDLFFKANQRNLKLLKKQAKQNNLDAESRFIHHPDHP